MLQWRQNVGVIKTRSVKISNLPSNIPAIAIHFAPSGTLENPEEMYIGLSRPKLILDIIGTEKNIEILNKISEDG